MVLAVVDQQTTMQWNSLLVEVHHTHLALQVLSAVAQPATMELNSLLTEVHPKLLVFPHHCPADHHGAEFAPGTADCYT